MWNYFFFCSNLTKANYAPGVADDRYTEYEDDSRLHGNFMVTQLKRANIERYAYQTTSSSADGCRNAPTSGCRHNSRSHIANRMREAYYGFGGEYNPLFSLVF